MALLFEEKIPASYRPSFVKKVAEGALLQKYNPSWIMAVMSSESGFSASVKNSIGCVGLIQFCPDQSGGSYKTIAGKKIDLNWLRSLSPVDQLDYVFSYYSPLKNKITRFHDLYMATFYPAAMGKADDFVIGSEKSPEWVKTIAKNNPAIDINKDGRITVGEFRQFSLSKVPESWRSSFAAEGMGFAVDTEKYVKRNLAPITIVAGTMLLVGMVLYYSNRAK